MDGDGLTDEGKEGDVDKSDRDEGIIGGEHGCFLLQRERERGEQSAINFPSSSLALLSSGARRTYIRNKLVENARITSCDST